MARGTIQLVVALKYSAQIAFIRFVGTHADYDGDSISGRSARGRPVPDLGDTLP
jgi:hypothetical protein